MRARLCKSTFLCWRNAGVGGSSTAGFRQRAKKKRLPCSSMLSQRSVYGRAWTTVPHRVASVLGQTSKIHKTVNLKPLQLKKVAMFSLLSRSLSLSLRKCRCGSVW